MPSDYKPKGDHPWRQYNKRTDSNGAVKPVVLKESQVKIFIVELAQNWDDYTVSSFNGNFHNEKIRYMSDEKAANWIIAFLKRHFVTHSSEYGYDPLFEV